MGKSKNILRWIGVAAAIAPWYVIAAETSEASGELEEITVTAQKRAESQQNVPLSMTTFSSTALEQKSISTFFDYATKQQEAGLDNGRALRITFDFSTEI